MLINEANIEFSVDERDLIKQFFDENWEYINSTDLYDYENLKIFGNLYQKFLEVNNQTKNDKLLLLLAEIRYNQLSYKLTKDSLNLKVAKLAKKSIPNFIIKWYKESRILMYKTEIDAENKKALQLQLNQNAKERSASFKDASKKIVK